MSGLLSSPSLVALGLDPAGGKLHIMVRTEAGERRESMELTPTLLATFKIIRGMLL